MGLMVDEANYKPCFASTTDTESSGLRLQITALRVMAFRLTIIFFIQAILGELGIEPRTSGA